MPVSILPIRARPGLPGHPGRTPDFIDRNGVRAFAACPDCLDRDRVVRRRHFRSLALSRRKRRPIDRLAHALVERGPAFFQRWHIVTPNAIYNPGARLKRRSPITDARYQLEKALAEIRVASLPADPHARRVFH